MVCHGGQGLAAGGAGRRRQGAGQGVGLGQGFRRQGVAEIVDGKLDCGLPIVEDAKERAVIVLGRCEQELVIRHAAVLGVAVLRELEFNPCPAVTASGEWDADVGYA